MGFKLPGCLVSCLFALAFLPACSDKLTDAGHVKEAKASMEAGKVNAAVIHLKSALQLNPENFDARYMLGVIYLEQGQLSAAEKELSRARQIDSLQPYVLAPLAESLYGQGKYPELLEKIVPMENIDPVSASEVYSYRSQSWLGLGEVTKAGAELSQAKALSPDTLATRTAELRLKAKQGDLVKTRELIEAIVAQEPSHAEAWSLLGGLEYASGALDEAEAAYGNAIGSRENNAIDHLKRAVTRIALKDYSGAEKDIRIAGEKAPDNPLTLYAEGLLLFRQERFDEAQLPFEKALNRSPDFMEVMFYLGANHLARNQLSQAEANLKRYLTAHPESKHARSLLAHTYNKMGKPDRTLALLKSRLEDSRVDPAFLILAGEAYLIKQDPAAAATLLEEAADLTPETGATQMMAGLAQLQAGKEAAGVKSLETAAGLGKEYRTGVTLGFYYLNTGQLEKALETIAKLEIEHPDDPDVLNLKGRVYLRKVDFARARSSFEKALALKPDMVTAILSLASLDLRENNVSAARKRYESLLDMDRNTTAAMMGLADLALLEGRQGEYAAWLERAVKANPSALVPRTYLANYHLEQGETDAALRNAREAAAANPGQTGALALLGKVQLATGEKEGALITFRQLHAKAPESADVLDQLARAYAATGQVDEAREALQKALEFDPQHLDYINALSTLEAASGNHEAALELALRYQQLSPDSSAGSMLEGDALTAANRNPEAVAAYEKALARDPEDGRVIVKLHVGRLRLGEADSADEALMSWLEGHPGKVVVRNYLARSFLKRGLDGYAREQYETLAKLTPGNALVFNNLAVLYQRAGDPRALATAETAFKVDPDSAEIADTLGWILVRQGQLPRGLELIKEAAAADAGDPERQYHLAYGLAQAGQADEAQKVVTRLQQMNLNPGLENEIARLARQLSAQYSP